MNRPFEANLSGKTCIVTGANTGIGKEIARDLAKLGADVVLACRSESRARIAESEIKEANRSARLSVMQVDVSSQASLRAFAKKFDAAHPRLDVLVNNAGVMAESRELTEEGIERTWATNVLGYTLMTELLLPKLKASGAGRIVAVASTFARNLDVTDVQFERRKYNGMVAYAQSKQANRMWAWALASRLEGTNVTINVAHPGLVSSELAARGKGLFAALNGAVFSIFGKSPAAGADTASFLAAGPEVAQVSGKFWMDRHVARCKFNDPAACDELFALVEKMTRPTAS